MESDIVVTDPSRHDSSRIVHRLQFYFAALSCLGGLSLASGSETESIPVIAVFFSVFGFIFVDYLRLFALPPIAAYAAMAVAAFYCVSNFADLDAPGNHQMVAVAQLLVLVQAILMLQRKSRRIFEQLGVFCLLELVVAAVFNNAITFGLLLIPIGIIGARAMCLLASVATTEGLQQLDEIDSEESSLWSRKTETPNTITVQAPNATRSLIATARRLPRVASITLTPAVVMVSVIFFYAIPRTTDASRSRNGSNALVGFSDSMNLEQIGQMQQSTARAMRIRLTNRVTEETYRTESLYLRGRVLERYSARLSNKGNSATWQEVPADLIESKPFLPGEHVPIRSSDTNFYDSVDVSISVEALRSNALFAIAPYHVGDSQGELVHSGETWTVSRERQSNWIYPRKTYDFGTNAFQSGMQSEWIARHVYDVPEGVDPNSRSQVFARVAAEQRAAKYDRELLGYDIDAIPSAKRMSDPFTTNADGERLSDAEIAKSITSYLATSPEFQYTLNLNAEPLPGMDPIEQFLSIDRKGHCQYFASALVMMLRSQEIPARVVVGYLTDEFNDLGQYYVARQLHAHSWVEVLIDREDLGVNQEIYGQPKRDQYWLRLDPTPNTGRMQGSAGGVAPYIDVAQTIWDDYVVDMDATTQQETALLGGGMTPMNGSYARLVEWMSNTISKIRAGELGGGSLASRNLFSWQGAVVGCIIAFAVVIILRIRPPAWLRHRFRRQRTRVAARPQVEFYAQTLDQLARVGILRAPAQTPDELRQHADQTLEPENEQPLNQPLARLTSFFYRARFGHDDSFDALSNGDSSTTNDVEAALTDLTQRVDRVIAQGNKPTPKSSEQHQ
ncbi:MAG: DUF3488 and transglutaminase-like domain-containing protein [Planctomycetota bacterium]